MTGIPSLVPIGVVHSSVTTPDDMPHGGVPAEIEVFAEYAPALDRLEEHSHAWILSWFHKAERDRLHIKPSRVDPNARSFGVFALRAFSRPNPIGLTLVEIHAIRREPGGPAFLELPRLDAIDGTPAIDIKPYFENDTVFSPRTPYLRPKSFEQRRWLLYRHALQHHLEDCECLHQAVRICLIAEERFGHLNSPDLIVHVTGPACVADVVQGVTRARLDNPARFAFTPSEAPARVVFQHDETIVVVEARAETGKWLDESTADEALFSITEQPGR